MMLFRPLNGSIDQSESRNKLIGTLQQVPTNQNQEFNYFLLRLFFLWMSMEERLHYAE